MYFEVDTILLTVIVVLTIVWGVALTLVVIKQSKQIKELKIKILRK